MSGTISQDWCTNWTKVNTSSWETVLQDFGQNGGLQLRGLNSKNQALEIDREKTYVWQIKWNLLVHALKRCLIHIGFCIHYLCHFNHHHPDHRRRRHRHRIIIVIVIISSVIFIFIIITENHRYRKKFGPLHATSGTTTKAFPIFL